MAANTQRNAVSDYQERLNRFQDTDRERTEVISQLIESLGELRNECQIKSNDLERERVACRMLQEQNRELQALKDRRGFVVVLIDADADDYIFREKFLNQNEVGGNAAADELHSRIRDYVMGLRVDFESLDIVVRAYANIKSLQSACVRNGKMKSGASLSLFAQGFTQRRALFDFVDAGAGKEEADNKIRECLNFYVENWQCKHIILGVCHDGGYKSFLGKFASDVSTCDRITLLEGGSINPRIRGLGFPRAPIRLDSVFAPNTAHAAPSPQAHHARPSSTGGVLPPTTEGGSSSRVLTNPAALSDRLELIRDESGKRVDKPLSIDPNPSYLNALRQNKLCGYYHLRGRCEGTCDKNHVPLGLDGRSFDHLWYLSRQAACYKVRKGKDCADPKCIYGH